MSSIAQIRRGSTCRRARSNAFASCGPYQGWRQSKAAAFEWWITPQAALADTGRLFLSMRLADLWAKVFPLVVPPEKDGGLGIMLLNSNSETHFSFTNALGLISAEQVRGIEIVTAQYPRARWLIALHHHPIEYPRPAKALSERIGTALINGSWFIRRLRRWAGRLVLMHGHRHIDWTGECAGLVIISAPSPVMSAPDEPSLLFLHTDIYGWPARAREYACARADHRERTAG